LTEQLPDAPNYERLELLEFGNERDLTAAAIEYAQAALPEWEAREGNTEVVLIESLAMMLGVEVLAIQMLPERLLELLMGLYGVTRDQGSTATGRATFEVTSSNPTQVIPSGTTLRYQLEPTGETIDVVTAETLSIITSESTTGSVEVIAVEAGTAPNGVPAGATVHVVDNLTFVNRAYLSTGLTGGSGVEEDEAFYARAAASLARLNSTLTLAPQFQYAALSQPGIGRAKVFDRYNPATGATGAAGHVTLAIADPQGQPLPADDGTALANWLAAQALASLQVHVIDPTYTAVDLAVTIVANAGTNHAQVEAATVAALEAWLSPATWDWSPEVAEYAVVSIISDVPGVAAVLGVPDTIALPGKAPLPTAGTISVTVQ